MATKYSSEVAISGSYQKWRIYLSASVSNTSNTTCRISYTATAQMTYAYHYGLRISCGGTSNTGVLTSNPGSSWANVCSTSGTINVARGTSAKSYTVTASASGATVSGYSGAPGSTSVSISLSIPALSSYRVTYNANGGSGAPAAQTKYYGQTLKLSTTKPTRSGYTFKGWGTSADDTIATYQAGANYTSNASITLYAVWSLDALVEFDQTGETPTITIPDSNGVGSPTAVNVPIKVTYVTANANTNIYYRICYADNVNGTVSNPAVNSLNKMVGPTKASTLTSSTTIQISADLVKQAIIAQQSEEMAVFLIQVSNGDNSFNSATTTDCVVTVNISNFRLIDGELYAAYWQDSSKMYIEAEFGYPLSYTLTSANTPIIKAVGSDTNFSTSNAGGDKPAIEVTTDTDRKRVRFRYSITDFDTDCFAVIEATDGLSTGKVYFRIVPYSFDQSITVDKENKSIEAVEFIEHSKLYGFQRGGRVYFPNFTEISEGGIGADALNLMMYDMKEREA